jgi:hypothetical protein
MSQKDEPLGLIIVPMMPLRNISPDELTKHMADDEAWRNKTGPYAPKPPQNIQQKK